MAVDGNLRIWTIFAILYCVLCLASELEAQVEFNGKRVRRSDLTVMNPRFRSHAPRKQEVMLGDRLKLRCAAVSKPRPYVHWYRNNELLSKGHTKPRIKISQYSLTITRVEPGDEGQYACKVWNQVGQIWRNFTVVIIDLEEWKMKMKANAEKAAQLHQSIASLNKDPEQLSEWLDPEWVQRFGHRAKPTETGEEPNQRKDEDDEDEDSNEVQTEKVDGVIPVAPQPQPPSHPQSPPEESSGWASLTTTQSSVSADSVLSMEDRPQNDFAAPWWDRTGMGLTGIGGLPSFVGNGPAEEQNASTPRTTQRGRTKTTSSTPSTAIPAYLLDTWERAPYWQKHEQEMLQVIATPAGRSVKLSCRANGKPEPQVLWYKDNVEISADTDRNSGYTYVIKKWALILEDVVPSDEGVYTCKVFNKLGEISHNYTLKVVERLPHKPIIDPERPRNMTHYLGENATFECRVLSDLHPHIEWLRHYMVNGSFHSAQGQPYVYRVYSDPEMETDEDGYQDPTILFIRNVTLDDQGWYTCLAGNNIGISFRTVYLEILQRNDTAAGDGVIFAQATSNDGKPHLALGVAAVLGVVLLVISCLIYKGCQWKKKRRMSSLRPMGSDIANGFVREKKIVKINYQKDYLACSLSSTSLLCSSDDFPVPHVEILPSPDNRCRLSTQLTSLSDYDIRLDPEWRIETDALKLEKPIGEGAFGEVWCAKLTSASPAAIRLGSRPELDPQTVAVKTLKCSATDRELCDLITELEVIKFIGRHQNIINLLGYCTSFEQGRPLYVVVEFCANGNLRDYLRSQRPQSHQNSSCSSGSGGGSGQRQMLYDDCPHAVDYEQPNSQRAAEEAESSRKVILTEVQLAQLVHQIARGMEYLSSKKCVHRDLAARNVLVTDGLVMKIADFGLARNISETEYYKKLSDGRLPLKWMAPEALFDRTYTIKSDVWSYGILVWEAMSLGGTPYPSVQHQELFKYLREGNRMERPENCPEEIYRLMRACWNENPSNRPTFSEVVSFLDTFLMDVHPNDYLEVQSQTQADEEYGDGSNSVDEEATSLLPTKCDEPDEPPSVACSPSPPDSPVVREVNELQTDCGVDSSCQRASTSFSDSACSVDADMPSTSSPRSSTSSSVNLRLNSMVNQDYAHHRLSSSPLPSPREKLRPISEVFNEFDMETYEDRASSGGGHGANDSGHPSSRGGSYEGSSDSVDSGHSCGGTSSSDSYNERRQHRHGASTASALRRYHPRRRQFRLPQP